MTLVSFLILVIVFGFRILEKKIMYTVQVVRIPSLLFCSMDVFLGFETMLGKFLNERTFLFPTHTNSIISSRIAWLGC